jgi:RHH-type rel operon transcriptional repressor/antitoxin RelB
MPTTIRLSPQDEERLNRLAVKTGRSKAFYLRKAIEAHLDDMEDIYLAQSRLEAVRAGTEKTYSLTEVESGIGLED